MNNKLWQTSDNSLNPLVEAYTVGDDFVIDQQLLPYDIEASIAHAQMLNKIGTLNKEELDKALLGLNEILIACKEDKFTITKDQEDGHTAIEQYLTERYGEVGKKIHTGRSRNDQSLVMIRLFMKDQLNIIDEISTKLQNLLKSKIEETKTIPMPGYTHLQKAMPTTVGTWLDSYLSALTDFKISLASTIKIIDQNPLGSASGFGINNFQLDKDFTTQKLGFSKTQENPMYCGLSRGYFENIVLQTLSQIMVLSGKFASDMLLFTTSEFNFLSLPNSFTTGSSIMPQKRNYDLFEIMRGNVKVYQSCQNQIQEIVSTIGSGYQRDLQLTKKPFISGVELCKSTILLLCEIIPNLQINEKRLNEAMTPDLFATEEVYKLVNDGKSFRDAYQEVKSKIK